MLVAWFFLIGICSAAGQNVAASWDNGGYNALGGKSLLTCTDSRSPTGSQAIVEIRSSDGQLCASWDSEFPDKCDTHGICNIMVTSRYDVTCPAAPYTAIDASVSVDGIHAGDLGGWTCKVTVDGSPQTETATLSEYVASGKPALVYPETMETTSLALVESQPQTITCQAGFGSQPAPEAWLEVHIERTPGAPEILGSSPAAITPGMEFSVTFTPALTDEDALIYCAVKQAVPGSVPAPSPGVKFTLQVAAIEELSITDQPSSIIHTADNGLLGLICQFRGNPSPEVTVLGAEHPMISTPIGSGTYRGFMVEWNSGATIKERRMANSRVVTCTGRQAYMQGGNIVSKSGTTTATINVQYGSETPFALILEPSRIALGDEVHLICEVMDTGNPPAAQYSWYRDGEAIAQSPTETRLLNFTPDKVDQGGYFTCAARNLPVLSPVIESAPSPPASLVITVPPILLEPSIRYRELAIIYSSSFILSTCLFTGLPAITAADVRWYDDNKEILKDASDIYTFHFSAESLSPRSDGLTIGWRSTIRKTIEGVGTTCDDIDLLDRAFTCEVGDARATTMMRTQYPVMWSGVPWDENYLVKVGQNYELRCNFCASPAAAVEWKFNGDVIPNEDDPVLQFANLTEAQTGEYSCHLTNRIGSNDYNAEYKTNLAVYPVADVTLSRSSGVITNTKEGEELDMSCVFMGHPIPTLRITGAAYPLVTSMKRYGDREVGYVVAWAEGSSMREREAADGRVVTCMAHQTYGFDGEPTDNMVSFSTTLKIQFSSTATGNEMSTHASSLLLVTLAAGVARLSFHI